MNIKLIAAVVFACACVVQGLSSNDAKASSHSVSVSELNSPMHQQSLQASETCSGPFCRKKVPGGSQAF